MNQILHRCWNQYGWSGFGQTTFSADLPELLLFVVCAFSFIQLRVFAIIIYYIIYNIILAVVMISCDSVKKTTFRLEVCVTTTCLKLKFNYIVS